MASGSIPSVTTAITDTDEYASAQEEVDSATRVQNEVEDGNENKDENETADKDESEAEDGDDEADVNELTVFIPQIPLPQLPHRPQTTFVKQIKAQRREQIMEQEKHQIFKILCGVATLLTMFGTGALMVLLAIIFDIEDLFVLGGMFGLGGIIFTVGFIIARCTVVMPYDKGDIEKPSNDLTALQSPERKDAPTPTFEY